MYGGLGNDTYFVDNAMDNVVELTGEGTDAVFASVNYTLAANVEALVVNGPGNLSGTGNALASATPATTCSTARAAPTSSRAMPATTPSCSTWDKATAIPSWTSPATARRNSLQFVGFGGGTTFTNIDATHWELSYNGGASHDIITFMNGAAIDATDFVFM